MWSGFNNVVSTKNLIFAPPPPHRPAPQPPKMSFFNVANSIKRENMNNILTKTPHSPYYFRSCPKTIGFLLPDTCPSTGLNFRMVREGVLVLSCGKRLKYDQIVPGGGGGGGRQRIQNQRRALGL